MNTSWTNACRVASLALLATPAAGQPLKLDVAAEAFAYFVDRPTNFDSHVCNRFTCTNVPVPAERDLETGTWIGTRGSVRFRWVSLTVESVWGQLEQSGLTITDRDPRVTRALLQVHAGRWLSVGPTVDAWRSQRLADGLAYDILIRRYGLALALSGSLGVPGLRGSFQVDAFPYGKYYGSPDLNAANLYGVPPDDYLVLNEGSNSNTRFVVELEYAPDRVPVVLKFGFRSERFFFDEEPSIGDQQNQIRGIFVGGGLRLRR